MKNSLQICSKQDSNKISHRDHKATEKILSSELRTQNFELHTPRSESGVALILTLAVLAMILILIVGYATLTRTETQASANYRDYVASKYTAQGALNRAIAEMGVHYSNDPASRNGLATIFSSVEVNNNYSIVRPLGSLRPVNPPAGAIDCVTNIERIGFSPTGVPRTERPAGADDEIDYVLLPGQDHSPTADRSVRPQWIGMTDANGLLVGRMAYMITSGSLHINAIGNLVQNQNNPPFDPAVGHINSRNEGYSVAELNLPAALMAITDATGAQPWDYATAVADATEVLNYRYGEAAAPYLPGDLGDTTDPTSSDGLDNNGDGVIDIPGSGDDGALAGGVPQFYLSLVDGTDQRTITALPDVPPDPPDDRLFADLDDLRPPAGLLGAAAGRFDTNFPEIQRWFTTQSSMRIDDGVFNLNDNGTYPLTTVADRDLMYTAIEGRLATGTPFSGASLAQRVHRAQIAANIVTYFSPVSPAPPAPDANLIPYQTTIPNPPGPDLDVVGVGRVPFINQITFDITAKVTVSGPPGSEQYAVDLNNPNGCFIQVELWYPYTESWNLDGSRNGTLEVTLESLSVTPPFALPASQTRTLSPVIQSFPSVLFPAITNPTRFYAPRISPTPINLGTRGAEASPNPIVFSDFRFSIRYRDITTGSLFDVANPVTIPATAITATFTSSDITSVLPLGGGTITHTISFALDDPRAQDWITNIGSKDWKIEGNATITPATPILRSSVASSATPPATVGAQNFGLDTAGNPLFNPIVGEDGAYTPPTAPIPPQGIAPKTFFLKRSRLLNSVAELGRIHRGEAWKTIDFTGGGSDGALLDVFTHNRNPAFIGADTFQHGRVNLNNRTDAIPIWAALFAGIPIQTQAQIDAINPPLFTDIGGSGSPGAPAGEIDPAFTQSRALGNIIGTRQYSNLEALVSSVPELSDISTADSAAFPGVAPRDYRMLTDEDREYILSHILNLVTTQGQGNLFTVWAWGQALRGPKPPGDPATWTDAQVETMNLQRVVGGETLIVAMIQPVFDLVGGTVSFRTIYYRYNPDLEVTAE